MSSSCVREGKIFGNKYMLGVGRASIYIASDPSTMQGFTQPWANNLHTRGYPNFIKYIVGSTGPPEERPHIECISVNSLSHFLSVDCRQRNMIVSCNCPALDISL